MYHFSISIVDFLLVSIPVSVVFLFLYKPRYGFILFFATKFTIDLFWNHPLFGLNINILQFQGVLFIALCMVYIIRHKPDFSRHPLKKILMALLLSNAAASVWGLLNSHFVIFELVASPLSFRHVADWNFRFLNLTGAFVIIPLIFNDTKDLRKMIRIFTISTVIPVILAILEYLNMEFSYGTIINSDYSVRLFQRLTSGYHDPAVLAIAVFTGLSGSFYLFYTESMQKFKWTYFCYMIITAFILFHTYSRTMWITTLLLILIFLLNHKNYVYSTIFIVVIVILFFSFPSLQKRFSQEISYLKQDNTEYLSLEMTGTGRIGLWKQAAYHYHRLDYISKTIGSGGSYGSHNQYMTLLLKNGLTGLILFLIFLIQIFLKMNSYKGNNNSFIIYTTRSFLFSLFLSTVFFANLFVQMWDNISFVYYFWGLCGLGIKNNHE